MAISLNPFLQSTGLCGPASLKILLDYYGKTFTEEELARLCEATAERGTDHANMVEAVRKLGGEPIVKENATFDDIRDAVRQDIPVVVGWYSTFGEPDDHYSVVYAIDDQTISMMDPERDEGTVTISLEEFDKAWHDFDGPDDIRVEHWMMTVPTFTTP